MAYMTRKSSIIAGKSSTDKQQDRTGTRSGWAAEGVVWCALCMAVWAKRREEVASGCLKMFLVQEHPGSTALMAPPALLIVQACLIC